MSGQIYFLGESGQLDPMIEQPYQAEALLQELLANYPELLAGDQVDKSNPRRWLLVKRELSIPGDEPSGGRWSIDHLFIDQEGVPTLVEVKRSTDTRIRREVVGQMLDYAANGTAYWSLEHIQSSFEDTCSKAGTDGEDTLNQFLDDEVDPDDFWQRVKTNLQAGRVRMIFVADEIPSELQRVVEFLNEQMDPAECLAVEVKQYVGLGIKTLVPRVIGQTSEAQSRKGTRETKRWDRSTFVERYNELRGSTETQAVEYVLAYCHDRGLTLKWGTGVQHGSFSPKLRHGGSTHNMFTIWTDGTVQIQFTSMRNEPFVNLASRQELARRLELIPDLTFNDGDIDTKWPQFKTTLIQQPAGRAAFLAAWDWYLEQIRAS